MTPSKVFRNSALAALFATTALVGCQAALAGPTTTMGAGADITKMCGSKPASVALVDGYGGDTWRKTVFAELMDEATKCPNIKKVVHSDAGGDQQKYNSDINSFVAQGFDIIIAFTDFGDASLPALRAATQAGVTTIAYFGQMHGTPGVDYTANVYQDQNVAGALWGDWMGKNIGKGNVLMLGGPPGASASTNFFNGFKSGVAKYPELTLIDANYVATNWNQADAQKAVSGLIAKFSKIDGVAADYGGSALAAVKVFQQASLPVPAIAVVSAGNELNCKNETDMKAARPWKMFSVDGTTTIVRFAFRRGLAEFEGTTDPESLVLVPYVSADTVAGMAPKCEASLPPDADVSSLVPAEKLQAIFK